MTLVFLSVPIWFMSGHSSNIIQLLNDIETVEQVQRHFTKNLPAFCKFTYQGQLWHLHLLSLELRHLLTVLVRYYKILFGIVDMPTGEFFEFSMFYN